MRHRCEVKVKQEDSSGRYVWYHCVCYFLADTPELAMFQALHSTTEFHGFK